MVKTATMLTISEPEISIRQVRDRVRKLPTNTPSSRVPDQPRNPWSRGRVPVGHLVLPSAGPVLRRCASALDTITPEVLRGGSRVGSSEEHGAAAGERAVPTLRMTGNRAVASQAGTA